jgi:hypothetical protein
MKQPLIEFKRETNAKNTKQWRKFKWEVKKIFYEKNPYPSLWESPELPEKVQPETIFSNFIEHAFETEHYEDKTSNLKQMSIYPYKKEGLQIKTIYRNKFRLHDDDIWMDKPDHSLSEFQYYFIKACKDGFHRDWDKNAICVKDTSKDDWWKPLYIAPPGSTEDMW